MSSEIESILPIGWKKTYLGEISDFKGGSQPPKSQFIFKEKKGYVRFLQIRDFASDKNKTYIPISSKNRYCREDDILLGRYGASVGKILTGKAGAYNVAVMKTYPDLKVVNKEFFYLYLCSNHFQKNLLNVTSRRSAQAGFSKKDISVFPFPLPPLSEQKRISSKINSLFAKIDKAIELTEESLKQAENLLPAFLKQIFDKGKEEGWEEKKLGEVCDVRDGTHDSPKYINEGYALVTSKNLKNGKLDFEKIKYISEEDYIKINKRSKVDINDILFAMIGTIGNPVLVENPPNYAIKNVALFKQKTNEVIMPFLNYVLVTPQLIDTMKSQAKGSTQKFVGLKYLRDFMISFPTKEIQNSLVNYLDKINLYSKQSTSKLEKQLNYLKQLKSSILSKAFSGEL